MHVLERVEKRQEYMKRRVRRRLDVPFPKQLRTERARPSNARSTACNFRASTGFPTDGSIGPPFGGVNAHLAQPRLPPPLRLLEVRRLERRVLGGNAIVAVGEREAGTR